MKNRLGPLCLLSGAIAGLPAMLILLTVLAPVYVERARGAMRAHPVRSFSLGLVNFAFFTVLALFAESDFAPAAFVGAVSVVVVLPILIVAGLLATAGVVGERVWLQVTARSGSLLGSLVVGIVILGLAALVPILGWLFALGLVLTGLGAAITALFQRPPRTEVTQDLH